MKPTRATTSIAPQRSSRALMRVPAMRWAAMRENSSAVVSSGCTTDRAPMCSASTCSARPTVPARIAARYSGCRAVAVANRKSLCGASPAVSGTVAVLRCFRAVDKA
jgi:hypothetical protein